MDQKIVGTMRDLVTYIGRMMETAFREESDAIEKPHQFLGELAAVEASLQDTAITEEHGWPYLGGAHASDHGYRS
jgi:hypothetical protein